MAKEVADAFDNLIKDHCGLVKRFKESFEERAKITELCEARKNGLALALISPQGGFPDRSYFAIPRVRYKESDLMYTGLKPISDEFKEFNQSLHQALNVIINDYPDILFEYESYCQQMGCSMKDFIMALFASYSDNKNAYPY